jgi:hypothetical protein
MSRVPITCKEIRDAADLIASAAQDLYVLVERFQKAVKTVVKVPKSAMSSGPFGKLRKKRTQIAEPPKKQEDQSLAIFLA